MQYEIRYTPEANIGLAKLERSEPKAFQKALRFIEELREHPKTGTGHPEPLKGDRNGQWSREITKKHRLIYEIYDTEVVVLILTAYGHYNDK
jgi:toxin YoeB